MGFSAKLLCAFFLRKAVLCQAFAFGISKVHVVFEGRGKASSVSKLKTKSGVKKRFRLTKTGKVLMGQTGKRHGMRKRSPEMRRTARGSTLMKDCDAAFVKKHFMPYGAS